MNLYKFFVITFMLAVGFGLSTSAALAQDPDTGKVVWEEEIWQCQRCHGAMGEGMWGRPLSNSELTAEEWIAQVRMPRRFMPHFSEAQVTDQQIIDIHAYITSLPAPSGDFMRAEANLPADAPEGQMLIAQKNCIACHSETGPIDPFVERGEVPTAEAVVAQLRSPKNFMPSFTEDQVSDDEAAIIADFLAEEFAAQAASTDTSQDATDTGDQAEPATLPQSGGEQPNYPLIFMAGGLSLLLVGLTIRWRRWIAS